MTDLLDLAWGGFGPDRVRRLLASFGSAGGALAGLGADRPRAEPARLAACGARFVPAGESGFPPGMDGLADAPPWLFVRGEIPPGPRVAVVGSRSATTYGLAVAERIGGVVAAAGWPVVSGLARGIDAAAHRGCLDAGGRALAVLGSGIDVWYPRTNRRLGERILTEHGAVVSEFGPGTSPEPWRFPCRNRIISGLSEVVIVVEAAVRSGALITARLALEHGRDVFAVPGDIDRPTSVGCNLLIRDGAMPVTAVEDLAEALGFAVGDPPGVVAHAGALPDWLAPLPRPVDDVVEASDRPIGEVLAEITRMCAAGTVVLEEGWVRAGRS